jgi:hypothetical protein
MDWIDLVQDRDRWHDLVKAIMNLQVLLRGKRGEFFLTSSETVTLLGSSLVNRARRLEDAEVTGNVNNCLPNDTM